MQCLICLQDTNIHNSISYCSLCGIPTCGFCSGIPIITCKCHMAHFSAILEHLGNEVIPNVITYSPILKRIKTSNLQSYAPSSFSCVFCNSIVCEKAYMKHARIMTCYMFTPQRAGLYAEDVRNVFLLLYWLRYRGAVPLQLPNDIIHIIAQYIWE